MVQYRQRISSKISCQGLQKAHPNANHHCWAWRLTADRERSSDDGEPSGSAGEPILQRMKRAELIDSMIVVTRYFGGTKLGVGGLVRAYGGSAGEVITQVPLETLIEKDAWTISMQYPDQSLIKSIIASNRGKSLWNDIQMRYTWKYSLIQPCETCLKKRV